MDVVHAGSQPSGKAPAENFTGTVRIDPLFERAEPARVLGVSVTFEPCARTAWHTHPLGQTLIVTAGCGRVQRWGGPVEDIRSGDAVLIAPGKKHWHGAAASTAMTHIAILEKLVRKDSRLDGAGHRRSVCRPNQPQTLDRSCVKSKRPSRTHSASIGRALQRAAPGFYRLDRIRQTTGDPETEPAPAFPARALLGQS
jgi:quercetin dioxygenase-like cupin family protein